LALLRLLLSQETSAHLLLIGAYRDNEVHPGHPLDKLLSDLRVSHPERVTEVCLQPLQVPHVADLLIDSFRCDRAAAMSFAHLLVARTLGKSVYTAGRSCSALCAPSMDDAQPLTTFVFLFMLC
jgi:predicted ATPase